MQPSFELHWCKIYIKGKESKFLSTQNKCSVNDTWLFNERVTNWSVWMTFFLLFSLLFLLSEFQHSYSWRLSAVITDERYNHSSNQAISCSSDGKSHTRIPTEIISGPITFLLYSVSIITFMSLYMDRVTPWECTGMAPKIEIQLPKWN